MTNRRTRSVALTLAALLGACSGGSKSPGTPPGTDPGDVTTTDPGNVTTTDPGNVTTTDPGNVTTAEPELAVTTQWGPVSAPSFPATVCTTLAATLTPTNGSLDPVDADSTVSKPDQARLQAALNGCPAGQAVRLVTGAGGESAFLSGPLNLPTGVTLWVDAGVTLFASRNPADYENYGAGAGRTTCGTAPLDGTDPNSCNPFITASNTVDAGIVGDGVIDGRGGSPLTSGLNAFLRTWWDVAYENKVAGLNQQNPRLVQVNGGRRFTLHRITIQNAPNFHVVTSKVAGVTVWGVKLLSPSAVYTQPNYACGPGTTPPEQYSSPNVLGSYSNTPSTCFTPDTVKNTDGFDPGNTTSVVMAYSWVSVGDDDVAIKAGGTTGIASADLTFSHNHFYYGHGMSIWSETNCGVRNVRVEDLSMDGFDSPNQNGLRIKSDRSRGGLVTNVLYDRVCMRNVRRPMVLDAFYSSGSKTLYPQFTNIVVRRFHSLGGPTYRAGELTFDAYAAYPHQVTLDGVFLDGGTPSYATAHYGGFDSPANTQFTLGPGPVSFGDDLGMTYSGVNGVTVLDQRSGTAPPLDCTRAFPALKSVVPTSPF
jgi:polygalacturonase